MWVLGFTFLVIFASASAQENRCVCVIYYLCEDGEVITDGRGLIDERFGGKCECNCNNSTEVCCRLPNNQTTSSSTIPPDPVTDPVTNPVTDPVSVKPTFEPGKQKRCGVRNPDGVGFKIGAEGADVEFGEFPWMVGVMLPDGSYRCGGSLIHPSVVLTAAHCVTKKVNYVVRAGEWDSSNTREIFKHQDRTASSKVIHENFRPGIYYNDVALLFLESPFGMEAHIGPVCLASANSTYDRARCFVTGWGKDKWGGQGKYPAILKKVDLPVVESGSCQEKLRKTRLGAHYVLHNSFVCAGGEEGKDSCIGDGGGPLVCPINGNEDWMQQVGVVSWGIGCNQKDVPGVYASVPHLREWIDKKVEEKNFSVDNYQY